MITTWSIPAPLDIVWLHLIDTEKWPQWWRYVATVKEIATGNANGIGNIRQYVWRTCLPYQLLLTLRVIEVKPFRYLAVEVSGDLQGNGMCDVAWNAAKANTEITFHWLVNPTKPWMMQSTAVLKPVFTWNHNRVMKTGEQGLIQYLSSQQYPL